MTPTHRAPLLPCARPEEILAARRTAVDPATLAAAAEIVADVRAHGLPAVLRHARRLGDLRDVEPAIISRAELAAALDRSDRGIVALLERTAARIRAFAEAQRACLLDLNVAVDGGRAGHRFTPMERAGCYAPGGRYPLPSSALMTIIPARVAGVREVWLATPRPHPVMLAAAAVAGADAVLAIGGAQAIAALALGADPVPACDAVVGPGNRWVTATKKLVAGEVAIDMLAGPSELLILADASADPDIVAADLLAQAEHDADAVPMLVTTDPTLSERVEPALRRRLALLPEPNRAAATASLTNGFCVVIDSLDGAIDLANRLAPEHLELMLEDAAAVAPRMTAAGAVFVGAATAEVCGDYGAGPNHTLPTGGTARSFAGLSVATFLRPLTWLQLAEGSEPLVRDAVALAQIEGLAAHSASAAARLELGQG